jgi:hypothetical protein
VRIKFGISRLLFVGAAAVSSLALVASAAQAATLFRLEIPVTVGGARVCVDTNCPDVTGVSDLIVQADFTGSVILPTVTPATQPGCTANINTGVTITTPGLSSGTLVVSVSYQPVDRNGTPIGPRVALPIPPIPISGAAPQSHTITICTPPVIL